MYDFNANALQIFIAMTEKFKSVLGINCFHCRQGQTSSQTVQFPQDLMIHHVDFLTIVHDLVPVPKVTQCLPALLVLYVEETRGCVLKLHFEILSKQWETCFSSILIVFRFLSANEIAKALINCASSLRRLI